MKKKIILIIGVMIIINNILSERCEKYTPELYTKTTGGPFTNTGFTCGKENPKKQSDCTKYGTDSGMYCCWVAQNENDEKGKCHLISLKKIERSGIDGCANFTDSYWSCGNFSSYIKMKKIMLGFLVIIFFSG